MKYSLFLGCTVPTRARNYEMATRIVAGKLGMEFIDIPEFSCCGFPVKSTDRELSLLMSAANLALAQKHDTAICTLCSACTAMLAEANHLVSTDPSQLEWVNRHLEAIDLQLEGPVSVRHFSRLLMEEIGIDALKKQIARPLTDLILAPHYGCHYLKPSHVHDQFDSVEAPQSLQQLIEVTGATCADLEYRKDCCGGAILSVEPDLTYSMARRKLQQLHEKNVDAMTVICPFCAVVYDDNQKSIESHCEQKFNLPVLYYPQVLGLAMGFSVRELGLKQNKVKTKNLILQIQESSAND